MVKCQECGFTHDCVDIEIELCPECNKDIEKCRKCLSCKYPCRTPQERERLEKNELKQ